MPDGAWWAVLAFYGLVVLRWLWAHVELTRAVRVALLSPVADPDPHDLGVRLSVIIAAHDEEETIGRCLRRVLAQNYPDLQIIVANDRSSDDTGQIVRELARTHPNVCCIDIDELPPGWLGKTHALSIAAKHATGEYLVFTDSDVDWHPAMLATVVKLIRRERLDFLSLWPKVVLKSFWERFLLPACGSVLSLWFSHPRPDRIESTPAFANGQFLVIRREAYEQIGGHAAVPDEMAEDVALALRAQAAGLRRYLGVGRDLFQTRMYENLRQIERGWTRIFIGSLGARWKLVASILTVLLGYWTPFVVAGVLVARAVGGGGFEPLHWGWLVAAAVHLPAMYSVMYRHFALTYEGRPHVLLAPLALVGVAVLLVYCLLLISGVGSIRWGNVRYQLSGSRAVSSRVVS
ncbi:MAG: glycosyltransferase [Planctomycetes bacterium]|nr:glycosyltransferase [Planctomycetota bacterium]